MGSSIKTLRIGTRRSALALYQTHHVADLLRQAHPELRVEIVEIDTKGDLVRDVPLPEIGGKGLFTYEIEQGLLGDTIELAVHSLKDLPSALEEGLKLVGSPRRADPTDALVSTTFGSLEEVPRGATIATGSVRRRAQLLHVRPDLEFVDLRGNIDTRLAKLEAHGWAGIIMATAALHRLKLRDHVTQSFDPVTMVPAVAQGAIGIEVREGRPEVEALLGAIVHQETTTATRAERAFMRLLEGGCSAPVAAHCRKETEEFWEFSGWIGSPDGTRVLHEQVVGPDPMVLAKEMGGRFLDQGARDIIRQP